ncbi:MAG: sulfite exporter TauE/SafE family protein [Oscillospiraceae bacterium]|nr:sulfite exporter TauE/SafE family protein [Oscillospiraceae bacterium]
MHISRSIKCAAAGAAAGVCNGLFGTGGGSLLAPLLRRWAGLPDKTAMATSLAVITPLCLLSALLYGLRGALPVAGVWPCLLGGLAGGLLAGLCFRRLPAPLLRRALGLLLLCGGVRCLLS